MSLLRQFAPIPAPSGSHGWTRDTLGYPPVCEAPSRGGDWEKVMAQKPSKIMVFPFFQGHPLTLRDSKGHFCILLFRDASNGTGLVPLRRREGRKGSKPTNFVRYGFSVKMRYTVAKAPLMLIE